MKILTVTYLPETSRPFNQADALYRVLQIEQSTEFSPGQYMSKAEVQDLCDIPKQWKVIIKSYKPL
jgi:hypothetical protein